MKHHNTHRDSTATKVRFAGPLAVLSAAALLTACGGGGGGGEVLPPPVPTPVVNSVSVSTPKFSQSLLITVNGADLDRGLSANATGCSGMALSTKAPQVSTASTAYFTCTVDGLGAQDLTLTRDSDKTKLAGQPFTVPQPQVTMTVGNGAGAGGTFVITLDAAKAPLSVKQFLSHVNAAWYQGVTLHRVSAGALIQGGRYKGAVDPALASAPVEKPGLSAVDLEQSTGLLNSTWTLSMVRDATLSTVAKPKAVAEFSINLRDNPGLDAGATAQPVFGTVSSGTDVVSQLAAAPCVASPILFLGQPGNNCVPVPNWVIDSATQTR